MKTRCVLAVLAIAALAALLLAGCGEKSSEQAQTPAGRPVPDFQFTDVNGNAVNKADLAGKVIAVDFWATWCDSCTKKLVKYQPIYEQYQSQGLEFIVVSSDDAPATVKGWLKTDHPELTMPFVMKSDATNTAFWGGPAKYSIPVLKLIDRKGMLRYDLGPESTVEEAQQAIETLLAEK